MDASNIPTQILDVDEDDVAERVTEPIAKMPGGFETDEPQQVV